MEKRSIINKSIALGFSQCGFARCVPLEELRPFYDDFVREKRFAGMDYLERYANQRMEPGMLLPGARTVIALAMNYNPPENIPADNNFVIAKYAYGRDYHLLMRERLDSLAQFMRSDDGDIRTKFFVDSGPVLEKAWAQRCGIGWQGKNTLVINKSIGSFFFIGIILTNLEVEPGQPVTDHCGACDQCAKACPAKALDVPYQLNISRCISYLTIENKAGFPEGVQPGLSDRIYGCDICQDVCPYNRNASVHTIPEFLPSEQLKQLRKKDWIAMTEPEFDQLFAGSPVMRLGYDGLMRNIRVNS